MSTSYLDYLSKMQRAFLSETLAMIKDHVPKSHYSSLRISKKKGEPDILFYEGTDASGRDMNLGINLFQSAKGDGHTVYALFLGRSADGRFQQTVTYQISELTPDELFRMFKTAYNR